MPSEHVESNHRAKATQAERSAHTPNRLRTGVYKPLATVATLLAVGGGLTACASDANAEKPATTQSAEATPTPTPEVNNFTVEKLEISADLPADQAGKTFVQDRYTSWLMAGTGDTSVEDSIVAAGGSNLMSYAQKYAAIVTDALFIPTWKQDASLSYFVDHMTTNNASTLELWSMTYKSGNPKDTEPFSLNFTVTSSDVVSQTGDTAVVHVQGIEHANATKNRAATITPDSLKLDGAAVNETLTLTKVNGTWRLAAIQ